MNRRAARQFALYPSLFLWTAGRAQARHRKSMRRLLSLPMQTRQPARRDRLVANVEFLPARWTQTRESKLSLARNPLRRPAIPAAGSPSATVAQVARDWPPTPRAPPVPFRAP